MIRSFACILLAAIVAGGAIGQSTVRPAAFEVSDVRVSAKAPNSYMTSSFRGGRYQLRKATMLDLIRVAYDTANDKISGGPGWLETDRFDIVAKAPGNTTPEALREMLKALLAERFKLAIHNDMKSIPTFFLTEKAKKNMKPGDESNGPSGCQFMVVPASPGIAPYDTLGCRNAPMQVLINELRYPASPYLGVGPVLDKTGIEGGWDFNLKWTRRALLQQVGPDGITIFDALDKQLGLKLESKNAPTAVIVVDSVDRKPTENPAGVAERLPPPAAAPTEFEVADVKPTRPGASGNSRFEPNGLIEMRGVTLQNLIGFAWNMERDRVLGAPKWLDADRFDIIAKAYTDTPPAGVQIDFETAQIMMRALLKERFKLAVHDDSQPVSVYALTAPRRETKLKKADESNRASCKYSPELLQAGTALTNIWSCQNTTISDFAEKLRGWAPAYFDHPVVDLTEMEGSFDFTLGWTGKQRMPNGGVRAGDAGQPGGVDLASDPSGGITVFEAVERQLGLKLKEQKHPMPVLVIDHVEQRPTEN